MQNLNCLINENRSLEAENKVLKEENAIVKEVYLNLTRMQSNEWLQKKMK